MDTKTSLAHQIEQYEVYILEKNKELGQLWIYPRYKAREFRFGWYLRRMRKGQLERLLAYLRSAYSESIKEYHELYGGFPTSS